MLLTAASTSVLIDLKGLPRPRPASLPPTQSQIHHVQGPSNAQYDVTSSKTTFDNSLTHLTISYAVTYISLSRFYGAHLSRRLEVNHVQGLGDGHVVLDGEGELAGGANLGTWATKDRSLGL